ncbi:iron-enterobactin ABC transporter permease [Mycetocola tolaasinivorans]|uniref:Iron-enterobactin ABC transporter permease n=1 Tax=Mycetocola tolaasinivorans TaxID=76635 RepID=A0A3L7ADW5_9MICO|nr:iron-enterobactin ABC transporter permease [Mycetocola tolaasinivorans]
MRFSGERVLRLGGLSLRVHRRSFWVGIACLIVALAAAAYSLTIGDSAISLGEVWGALTGQADAGTSRIVLDWRLPRVLMALCGGAALAMSGAVFQTLTGNPLGSPDIIGFNTGAYTGALLSMLVVGGGSTGTTVGALIGGTATGALVYLLALRHGLHGYRLIVIGIGVSAMLGAINSYLMITVKLEAAISAQVWGAGSLNTIRWVDLTPTILVTLICLPLLLVLWRQAGMLGLGVETASGRGVNIGFLRVALLGLGVVLTAAVTAVAGPIAFVALVAPQIALRLTRGAGIPLLPTAFLGAALLVISDLVARTLLAPVQLPVGVVTVVLGGGYLVWMLISRLRKA